MFEYLVSVGRLKRSRNPNPTLLQASSVYLNVYLNLCFRHIYYTNKVMFDVMSGRQAVQYKNNIFKMQFKTPPSNYLYPDKMMVRARHF